MYPLWRLLQFLRSKRRRAVDELLKLPSKKVSTGWDRRFGNVVAVRLTRAQPHGMFKLFFNALFSSTN